MAAYESEILSQIFNRAKSYESFAEEFAKSRFMVLSSAYGQNSEELAALEKIASQIKCTVQISGAGISQTIDFESGDSGDYLDVIEHGMPAPQTGGQGGTVTNPDGSTRPSNVPEQLWGNPIDEYAKVGAEVQSEVNTMLSGQFAEEVRSIVSNSNADIARIVKNEFLKSVEFFG